MMLMQEENDRMKILKQRIETESNQYFYTLQRVLMAQVSLKQDIQDNEASLRKREQKQEEFIRAKVAKTLKNCQAEVPINRTEADHGQSVILNTFRRSQSDKVVSQVDPQIFYSKSGKQASYCPDFTSVEVRKPDIISFDRIRFSEQLQKSDPRQQSLFQGLGYDQQRLHAHEIHRYQMMRL